MLSSMNLPGLLVEYRTQFWIEFVVDGLGSCRGFVESSLSEW
jgi:hypothetical protein